MVKKHVVTDSGHISVELYDAPICISPCFCTFSFLNIRNNGRITEYMSVIQD